MNNDDIKIKSKVKYLQVVGFPSYDHIGNCLFFEGQKTDSSGNPTEEIERESFDIPHKLMHSISENTWLKIINFYIDLDQFASGEEKHPVGIKIDKYDSEKNMWCFLYEKIFNIKTID